MQKVVSNSSPLIHLTKIEKLTLLKEYFQEKIKGQAINLARWNYTSSPLSITEQKSLNIVSSGAWGQIFPLELITSLDEKFVTTEEYDKGQKGIGCFLREEMLSFNYVMCVNNSIVV